MKLFTSYISAFLLIIFIGSSCSDESVMLYHKPEDKPKPPPAVPEYYWLLETVTYPENDPGFSTRSNQKFTYTDDDLMKTIESAKPNDPTIIVDYISPKKVSYSRVIQTNATTTNYDSLLVYMNDKKQAEYALHVRYVEKNSGGTITKNITINDSTTFVYNADGNIIQLDHYDDTGVASSLNYSETYTIVDGNITEILAESKTRKVQFIYTYDDKIHAAPSEYCYEMPRNTFTMASTCWLMANLPFLSEQIGKRSKNNIIKTEINDIKNGKKYADISYEYTFDKNNLVSQIEMSGTTDYDKTFDNYITSFTYLEKEKK